MGFTNQSQAQKSHAHKNGLYYFHTQAPREHILHYRRYNSVIPVRSTTKSLHIKNPTYWPTSFHSTLINCWTNHHRRFRKKKKSLQSTASFFQKPYSLFEIKHESSVHSENLLQPTSKDKQNKIKEVISFTFVNRPKWKCSKQFGT